MFSHPVRRDFDFRYDDNHYGIGLSLSSETAQVLRHAPHAFSYSGALPRNWREDYYRMFLSHPEDLALVDEIIAAMRRIDPGVEDDVLAEMCVSFVQGAITYDWQTFHNIDQGKIRYPYETVWDGTGVCADKSMLLARILLRLGYGMAIFTFERANHMAPGIRVPSGFGNYRSDYAFIESTDYNPIGRVPEKYVGGTRLDRNPKVVELGGAKVFRKIEENKAREAELENAYGKEFLSMNPQQQVLRKQMVVIEKELKELKGKLKGCRGALPPDKYRECQDLNERYNRRVGEYNRLVNDFNQSQA